MEKGKAKIMSAEDSKEELKREQALIEAIFNSVPGYLYVYDESGRLVKWNKKYETVTGFTAEELSHMTLDQWFDKEDLIKVSSAIHDVFESGYGEVEAQLIMKSGEKKMTRFSGAPLILDEKKYFTGIGVDITESKRIEHEAKQNEERFQLLFEKAPLGYLALDSKGCFIEVNQKWLDTFGYNKDEVIGKWLGNFLCPEYIDAFLERFEIFKTQGYIQSEVEMLSKGGRRILIAFEGKIAYGTDGEFKQTHGIMQDITEQRKTEKALIESEKKYSSYIENAPNGVFVIDQNGNHIDVNNAATVITGYSREELLKMDIRMITADESQDHASELFGILVESGSMSGEVQYNHKNGSKRWWSVDAVKLSENSYLGFLSDITDRKKAESELLHLSYHDHLTGLYNRRFFEEELRRLDTKQNLPLSIIMCDVNGLKLVNDSFGHESGDALLKNAAEVIKKACRKDDVIARIGGDEFVLLLPKTSAHESVEIANHIKELASREKVANIELSISYGYDTKTMDQQSIVEIIANAENHMYRHKLYERSSIRSKTIDLIMNALFEKSKREAAHSSRVSSICQVIASKMNMNKDAVAQLKIAGLIHDIGKIGVEENILNKSGGLTIDERRSIERHPEIGWRLLSSTNEFSELAQFVLNHHEKWDGSGYPNGLKGEAIHLEARIIAVADAYDAMTSERSYRKPLSKVDAMKELTRCSGSQFDPEIIDLFINNVLAHNLDFKTGG